MAQLAHLHEMAQTYHGPSKYARLVFFADNYAQYSQQALEIALAAIQNESLDVERISVLEKRLSRETCSQLDSWKRKANLNGQELVQNLQVQLEDAQNSLKREHIRSASLELGEQFVRIGEYYRALKYFKMSSELFSSHAEQFESIWSMMLCAVYCKWDVILAKYTYPFTSMEKYCLQCLENQDISRFPVYESRFHSILGMFYLEEGLWKKALDHFADAYTDRVQVDLEFTSFRDLAVYSGLAALASCSRKQLKQCMNSSKHRALFLVVPWVFSAIQSVLDADLYKCLSLLEQHSEQWKSDLYLSLHLPRIREQIRDSLLMQYIQPYDTVSLLSMSADLHSELQGLQKELEQLIRADRISYRINSVEKLMKRVSNNNREEALEEVQKAADDYCETAQELIFARSLAFSKVYVGKEQGKPFPQV